MLSFRNNRRNIVVLRLAKMVNKEYILTYGYSCSLLAVPLLRSKWKRILDLICIYKTFLGLLYTLRYIRSHLRRAWNIIYKFTYTSLTYENKNTIATKLRKDVICISTKVICISFYCNYFHFIADIFIFITLIFVCVCIWFVRLV